MQSGVWPVSTSSLRQEARDIERDARRRRRRQRRIPRAELDFVLASRAHSRNTSSSDRNLSEEAATTTTTAAITTAADALFPVAEMVTPTQTSQRQAVTQVGGSGGGLFLSLIHI